MDNDNANDGPIAKGVRRRFSAARATSLTEAEAHALDRMRVGDMNPLADLLQTGTSLHPSLGHQLRLLLQGSALQANGLRLTIVDHLDRDKREESNWDAAFNAAIANAQACDAVGALMAEGKLYKEAVHEVAQTGGAGGGPVSDKAIEKRLTAGGFRRRKSSR